MIDNLINMIPKILEWKREYGVIYYIKLSGNDYIFKPITKGDYIAICSIQDAIGFDSSDSILKCCLLYPDPDSGVLDQRLAGEIDSLLTCISDISGFANSDKISKDLEAARGRIGSLESQMEILVSKAFPHLTLKDINNFSYDDLIRYVVMAESILDAKISIEKPKNQKQGAIDFNEENKAMGSGPIPNGFAPKQIKRGDSGK
jgi:hypothetical protein